MSCTNLQWNSELLYLVVPALSAKADTPKNKLFILSQLVLPLHAFIPSYATSR